MYNPPDRSLPGHPMKKAATFTLAFCFALALSWPTAALAGSDTDRQKQQAKVWKDYNKSLQRQQKKQAKDQEKQLKQWRKQHPTTTTVT